MGKGLRADFDPTVLQKFRYSLEPMEFKFQTNLT